MMMIWFLIFVMLEKILDTKPLTSFSGTIVGCLCSLLGSMIQMGKRYMNEMLLDLNEISERLDIIVIWLLL